ncbi:recombinase family protein [Streptomyces sp. NPDC059816]|uniref:recombinase family protein n=1 Tax=Streptomyces sp. NPDC059816 TaxID=3346960 RepID=UPI00365CD0E9
MALGPPIDLSDLTDLPGFGPRSERPRRPVFLGRVSTKDRQNPASSIPRQVALAGERLEPGEEFTAFYWDVESGMLPPDERGHGTLAMYEALGVPVRRDGGLQDLMERAEYLGFTHCLAERSDRVARAMLTALTVEHRLERAGVTVIYANEPHGGTESGQLRTRRYGQVEAEIYKATLMEMSRGGQIQHALNGWNHGVPPYPYTTQVDEKATVQPGRFGNARPKRKLVPHPDPRRFDAARELCRLRREEHLPGADIIAILSTEPDRYPGKWTHGLVEGLIANPKLTGHQVYNRKATRTGRPGFSRINPVSMWVWSPAPAHEAVVTVEEWKEAQVVTAGMRKRAEDGGGPLRRIAAAARRLGLTISLLEANDSHTLYQIGAQRIVLPTPIPDLVAQQVIDDMEAI